MSHPGSTDGPNSSRRKLLSAILLSLPMVCTTGLMQLGRGLPENPLRLFPLVITYVLMNGLFFLMVYTRRTDRYRAVFFITMAVCFVIGFISNLIEVRGSMALTTEDMASGKTPFCHVAIPMTLIPAALTRTIIFPGSILEGFANIAGMFVLWIGASLALGRGFCSWGCFFGGLEDGFSRLRKRPVIKKIPHRWIYLPYAVLTAVVLISALSLSPTYCEWLCPFKAVTEYVEITSFEVALQTVIFISLFVGLVVVLPVLTKRRTQCGLFCPMGAFQSFTNKISAFDIRMDRETCKDCGHCAQVCPTFSLDDDSMANGQTRISCSKCGKCVDACPNGSIAFHVKGTSAAPKGQAARLLFLYPAFLFLTTFGGGMIRGALYRILLLATTGSMIK